MLVSARTAASLTETSTRFVRSAAAPMIPPAGHNNALRRCEEGAIRLLAQALWHPTADWTNVGSPQEPVWPAEEARQQKLEAAKEPCEREREVCREARADAGAFVVGGRLGGAAAS
mmetsp:Transcript_78567/g.244044  ORF Transcript_78567/g.244044 Transcript_78567/m.244044 type:complete len:116 (+) Transcript_78567:504-851(+)